MRTEQFSLPLATSTQVFDTLVRVIRYDEGSGTGTPKIRIKSLSGGAFDVEMVPGRQIKLPDIVRGLHISNLTASAITGKITIGSGDISDNSLVGTVTLDAATIAALESVDLNAATINTLIRPLLPSEHYVNTANFVDNTPVQVFSAASNLNGAIIHSAKCSTYVPALAPATLIAKSSMPSSYLDGEVIQSTDIKYGGTNLYQSFDLQKPIRIAAGLGLFFVSPQAGTGNVCFKSCRYSLL